MGYQPDLTPVREFRDRLTHDFKVEKMVLFGSRARGDYRAESDWDLIIISSDFTGIRFIDRIPRMVHYWDYQKYESFEPLPYTPEEFERKRHEIGIIQEALKEGIEIE